MFFDMLDNLETKKPSGLKDNVLTPGIKTSEHHERKGSLSA
jgi:hypothetical protein